MDGSVIRENQKNARATEAEGRREPWEENCGNLREAGD